MAGQELWGMVNLTFLNYIFILLFYISNFKTFWTIFSLQAALNKLNVGPTYHMKENIKNNHFWLFEKVHKSKSSAEKQKWLSEILTKKGYRSSVDFPTSLYFKVNFGSKITNGLTLTLSGGLCEYRRL